MTLLNTPSRRGVLALTLCVLWSGASPALAQGRNGRVERTDRTSQRIALGTSGLLELRNVAGDVTVTAGGGGDVVLEVVKRSRARTEADAALGLERVTVSVSHRGDRATVETVYPRGRSSFDVTTTYTVTAPAGTRVSVGSISGNVSVQGITGDVSVDAISGHVTVQNAGRISQARSVSGNIRLADVAADGAISAGTMSGDIIVERAKARRVTAENVSGTIRAVDISADSAVLKSLSGNVEYSGTLARNGRYEFDSHSGTVRIGVAGGAGFELQAQTFSGRVRPEGLSLGSVKTAGGQVRATVGDASAVVVAKTFSGDVVISRR
jgi:DUF4097 and DUF4098 domain-containing protein YvlB